MIFCRNGDAMLTPPVPPAASREVDEEDFIISFPIMEAAEDTMGSGTANAP